MGGVEQFEDVVDVVSRAASHSRRLAHRLEVAGQGGAPVEEVDCDGVQDPPAEVGEAGPEEAEVEKVTATESGREDAEDVGEVEENSVG